mgnify:CR=1 FL=1
MNNETKWTKGPWVVTTGFNPHMVESKYNPSGTGGRIMICLDVGGDTRPNPTNGCPEANARLIAAAPELYEALAVLLNMHDAQVYVASPWNESMEKARNILAKARGEQ